MSFFSIDLHCEACGETIPELVKRSEAPGYTEPCPCGGVRVRCVSAPAVKTVWGQVAMGKSEERPPHVMDTRPLADGMPLSEFRKLRDAKQRDARHRQIKEMLS